MTLGVLLVVHRPFGELEGVMGAGVRLDLSVGPYLAQMVLEPVDHVLGRLLVQLGAPELRITDVLGDGVEVTVSRVSDNISWRIRAMCLWPGRTPASSGSSWFGSMT